MDPEQVRRNLERVREQIGSEVEVLAAVKYVEAADLPALAEAGIELVGENRAQELLAKQEAHGDLFSWDFIGQLQSRKVKDVAPNVRLIHSLASESARDKLEQHPAREVLVQVNVAGEEGKAGIAPEALALAMALSAPSEPILRWVSELRPVGLEISGADLLAAGVPEGPAVGRALDDTLNRKLDGLVSGRDEELETALLLAREHAQ